MNRPKALKYLLAGWYKSHLRNLPWRRTTDPYRIWLSEMILQQTRVEQGTPYYQAFIKQFPTVQALSRAREKTVLKAWQGLGYYSRARHMLATARLVMNKFGGRFPESPDDLQKLPGIGPYTAAAVSSIAFGKPFPLVDGNVYRFLSRYYGITTPVGSAAGKKIFLELAGEILDHTDPGRHNQAVMEFGALQCTPVRPACAGCPLKKGCRAYQEKRVSSLPVIAGRKKPKPRRFSYFVIRWNEKVILGPRSGNDIWKNLYDFPMVESDRAIRASAADLKKAGVIPNETGTRIRKNRSCRHLLTHQTLQIDFFELRLRKKPLLTRPGLLAVPLRSLGRYPVPRVIEKHLATLVPGRPEGREYV